MSDINEVYYDPDIYDPEPDDDDVPFLNDFSNPSDHDYLFHVPDDLKPMPKTELESERDNVGDVNNDVTQSILGKPLPPDFTRLPVKDMFNVEETPEAAMRRALAKANKRARTESYKSIYDFRTDVIKNRGTKDLVDAVIETAIGYVSKNDKLDLCGWDILDTEKRSYKYVSMSQITDFSRRDTTLRKAVFRRSFLKFIETGDMTFIPLEGRELVEYILEELFQSPDLLPSSQGYNRFSRTAVVTRKNGTQATVNEYADTIRFSCTPDALRLKFNTLMSNNPNNTSTIVSYYKKHGIVLDLEQVSKDFSACVNETCRKVCEGNIFGLAQESTCEKLERLDNMLKQMERNGTLRIYTGQAGSGKAMPVDTLIPTPRGDRRLGDLHVGDIVFDRLGNMTRILEIFDHESKPCYEVTLNDGRTVRCCDEHQWTCFIGGNKRRKMTLRLREIIENGVRNHYGEYVFYLPMNGCTHYTEKPLPVHPYAVGAFLSCGKTDTPYLSFISQDAEFAQNIARSLGGKAVPMPRNTWMIADENDRLIVRDELFSDIPEVNNTTTMRHIPRIYLNGAKEQRVELLRGIMDGRGNVGNKFRNSLVYYTGNKELSDGIADLSQGLGFYTYRKVVQNKKPKKHKQGQMPQPTVTNLVVFHVTEERVTEAVSLQSKLEQFNASVSLPKNPEEGFVCIKNIRRIADCQQRCIMVDNAEHLYLANSYVVTHNSHKAIDECFPTKWEIEGHSKGTLLVSLSTLVAINGADRAMKHTRPCEPCSITMYNYCAHNKFRSSWVTGYATYCIDEFSQWGMEQLDTFISIVNTAFEENAKLVVLGDLGQIGTFLGRGNLLYMLTSNYRDAHEELTVNHRIEDNRLLDLIESVRNRQMRPFGKFNMDMVALRSYVHRKPEDGEMCITGSNSCAGLVNELRLEAALRRSNDDRLPKFYVPTRNAEWNDYDMWTRNEEWIRSRMKNTPIRVRPKENFKFEKGAGNNLRANYDLKFLRNETCIAQMVSEWTVCVISCVFKNSRGEPKTASIAWGDFVQNFMPYYAVTVNKAQGLEWNDVVIVYGDPESLDDRQVREGYVPKKNYNLNSQDASQATYVAISRPKQTLQIYCGNTRLTQQSKPCFADHMDITRPMPSLT